jgi:hypothetical protein
LQLRHPSFLTSLPSVPQIHFRIILFSSAGGIYWARSGGLNVRIDCPKYPAVAWNKITVASGAGVLYEAPLLPDNATIQAGDAARSLVQATLSGVAPL